MVQGRFCVPLPVSCSQDPERSMETIHSIKMVIIMKYDYLKWIFDYLKNRILSPEASPRRCFFF